MTNDKQVESTQKKTYGKRKFVEWSEEEDLKLTGCFEKYGSDWRKIKDELGCNRSLEQIRKRARHLNLNKPKRARKTVNNNTSSNKTPNKKTKTKATTPNTTTPTKARSRLIPILPADYRSVYTYLSWSLKYNSRDLIDERMDIGEKPELTSKGKVILKSFIDHLINNTNELFTQRQRKFIMQKLYLLKQALTPGGNEKITIGSSTPSNPLSIPSDLLKSVYKY
ncbi:13975_t:CDS:2 [Entrophospora sp. SA101]|nr:13975_t:CDS:2 [Entrophospora sp. SA101]CAJ0923972.1 22107_t:CDS:2 [Entrophospora sp. SA101]